jgi:hypothetical protein
MSPRRYYQVKPEAYLFGKAHGVPEEEVRQWCLAELMSSYGAGINDLHTEWSVKVGSRRYRADVVVKRDSKPFVLVECKKRGHAAHDHGIAQAISYADSSGVKAEYAVYTNGEVWAVRRRVGTEWVAVPDLPRLPNEMEPIEVERVMSLVEELWPILHCLGGPVSVCDAARYLSAWQRFLNGANEATQVHNRDVLDAADNVFRVAAQVEQRNGYLSAKLAAAVKALAAFAEDRQLPFHCEDMPGKYPMMEILHDLGLNLEGMVRDAEGQEHPDVSLLRFIRVAVTHIEACLACKPTFLHPELRVPVRQEFQDVALRYLRSVLRLGLDWAVPDPLKDPSWDWSEIRDRTKPAWDAIPTLWKGAP